MFNLSWTAWLNRNLHCDLWLGLRTTKVQDTYGKQAQGAKCDPFYSCWRDLKIWNWQREPSESVPTTPNRSEITLIQGIKNRGRAKRVSQNHINRGRHYKKCDVKLPDLAAFWQTQRPKTKTDLSWTCRDSEEDNRCNTKNYTGSTELTAGSCWVKHEDWCEQWLQQYKNKAWACWRHPEKKPT